MIRIYILITESLDAMLLQTKHLLLTVRIDSSYIPYSRRDFGSGLERDRLSFSNKNSHPYTLRNVIPCVSLTRSGTVDHGMTWCQCDLKPGLFYC